MGQIGIWQVVIVFVMGVLPVICFWRILPRAGMPAALALLALFPLVTFIFLAVLAFKKWPGDE